MMSAKNVLIVDDEKAFLRSVESGFEPFRDRFQVVTAENGRRALEVLEEQPIDLVVTDLHMPVMDGIELLACMNTRFPGLPASVITAFRNRKSEKVLRSMGVLSLLDKPVAFDDLIRCIEDGLNLTARGGSLTGVSVGGFLQLIEMERKTCLLEVSVGARKAGVFHFVEGVLHNAVAGGLRGREAALEMVGWEGVGLDLKDVPPGKRVRRTVHASLMKILLDGMRRKDESSDRPGGPDEKVDDRVVGAKPGNAPSTDGGPEGDGGRSGDLSRQEMDAIWPAMDRNSRFYRLSRSQAGLRPLLSAMADEMTDPVMLGVVGPDGSMLAAHSPAGVDAGSFAAKLSMLVKLSARAVEDLGESDPPVEQTIRTRRARILLRMIGRGHYLIIAVRRTCARGLVRMVARKFAASVEGALQAPPAEG